MRPPRHPMEAPLPARLVRERREDREIWWTQTVGAPPSVYGERWIERGPGVLRSWDPSRSKIAAALEVGWAGDLPDERERWLYLGAATGTTASHVADLVGREGAVFAIERSPRAFRRLLGWVDRWPNVLPILADARAPLSYAQRVPWVDGVYTDVAQPDQVEIALENARRRLREGGSFLLALKTASMGRDAPAPVHLERALASLEPYFDLAEPVRLNPWHRGHYMIGGRARVGRWDSAPDLTPSPARPVRSRWSPHPRRATGGPGRRSDRGSGRSAPRPERRGTKS